MAMPELINRNTMPDSLLSPTIDNQAGKSGFMLSLFALVLLITPTLAQAQEGTEAQTVSSMVDLVEIYEQARTYDAEFQTALHELEASRSLVPLARSALRPQLSLGAELGIASIDDDGEGPFTETGITLSLSQAVFDLASSKEVGQAEIAVRQAEAQYAAIGQALILRVATAYFDVLRAQASLEFSQSELEAIGRQREQAERRFDVGLVPITDVRTAQAQADLAVALEIVASNQLETAREALIRISGVDAQRLTPAADDLPLRAPDPANIDTWVELALQQNLELIVAQLSYQDSKMQIDIEKANRYPTVNLVGAAAQTTTEQPTRPNALIGDIGLQLQLPLLTGGSIKASIAQARSSEKAAEQQLLLQERSTRQQTRDAYRGVQASISQVQALARALESTEKSAEATEAGFRAGTRTSVEVLQALRDTFGAKSDFVSARYDYIINSLSLKAASGTLSEDDLYAINRFLAVPDDL